jgi:anti-sigma factor ChrR (cupin superfamily)
VTPFEPRSLAPEQIAALAFEELRPGVDIHVLHESPDGARVAILRYAAGAEVPPHRHEGYEYIYVLSGEQGDERGTYSAGSFVVNEPGMVHRVTSREGCVVLIMWQRPVVFI